LDAGGSGDLRRIEVDRGAWSEVHVSGVVAPGDDPVAVAVRALDACDAAIARLYGPAVGTLPRDVPGWLYLRRFVHAGGQCPSWTGVSAVGFRDRGRGPKWQALPGGARALIAGDGRARTTLVTGVARPGPTLRAGYEATFEAVFKSLAALGIAPGSLARTWCHFRDVLAAYDAFNDARRDAFRRHGVAGDRLPASTGIQAIPAGGEALVVDALAFDGPGIAWEPVANPAQCDAPRYGSLFSRCVRVRGAGPDQWLVSGMASIGEDGQSLHRGDREAQVSGTVERARALLRAGGLDLDDVVAGVAYLDPADPAGAAAEVDASPLAGLPLARAVGDVCRPELKFELELTAFDPR
jgi:enamine deaminase RidA (YjgF/YER057c/UK114 family)